MELYVLARLLLLIPLLYQGLASRCFFIMEVNDDAAFNAGFRGSEPATYSEPPTTLFLYRVWSM